MCRAFSLVPALEHEFFTLENPAHRLCTLRNEHVLALLSRKRVLERWMRKKIKRQQEREREQEKEREKEGNIHKLAPGKSIPSKSIDDDWKADRIQILEQIPQVSNEFDLKLYLIESKIFLPLCYTRTSSFRSKNRIATRYLEFQSIILFFKEIQEIVRYIL